VAAQGEELRGAVWLREHDFWVDGALVRAGWAKYPVAESLIDSAFAGVPGAMVFRLLREQPRLMGLGMGGHDSPYARLLRAMGWAGSTVPFYFLPVRPAEVLRRLRYVRRTRLARVVTDALALSGLGWLAWQAVALARRVAGPASAKGYTFDVVEHFGAWADTVWERSRAAYGFVSRRDAAMLNAIYPTGMPVVRLHVRRHGEDVGWACVVHVDRTLARDTVFGPLRVGLIADGLAEPEHVRGLIAAAMAYLRDADVDLVFSNQMHPAWIESLEAMGFLSGPSQFAWYRSPHMDAALRPAVERGGVHLNRGDCDGPVFWQDDASAVATPPRAPAA
jgi:hypothetical protein